MLARIMSCMLLCTLALAGGCSSRQGDMYTGKADYRYATTTKQMSQKFFAKSDVGDFKGYLFSPGDFISINLKNAKFSTISESYLEHELDKIRKRTTSGEIAIIANVTEGVAQPQFTGSDISATPGRIIFYSNDITKDEHISQSFNPVYGPVKWNGNPITIEITVIEVDVEENQQLDSLMKALASLGTRIPSPATEPIAVLNSIGQSFIASNHDDILYKSRVTLMPHLSDADNIYTTVLAQGDIVFSRTEKDSREVTHSINMDWDAHTYQPAFGELCAGTPRTRAECKSEGVSYIVFTITKNNGVTDMTPTQTFADIYKNFKNNDNKPESIAALTTAIAAFARNRNYTETFTELQAVYKEKNVLKRNALSDNVALALACSELAPLHAAPSTTLTARCGKEYPAYAMSKRDLEHLWNIVYEHAREDAIPIPRPVSDDEELFKMYLRDIKDLILNIPKN